MHHQSLQPSACLPRLLSLDSDEAFFIQLFIKYNGDE